MEYKPILHGLNLESYLILPVQRIPVKSIFPAPFFFPSLLDPSASLQRYVLLLQEMLKYTPPSHRDHENLKKALENMAELANYINTHKNTADNITKLLQIQDRIINWPGSESLVKPRRQIIREGTLLNVKKNKLTVVLFNDALLYTKPKSKGKLKFKGLINLTTASLQRDVEKCDFEIICPLGKFFFNCLPEEKVCCYFLSPLSVFFFFLTLLLSPSAASFLLIFFLQGIVDQSNDRCH
jgi:hypothetical protein